MLALLLACGAAAYALGKPPLLQVYPFGTAVYDRQHRLLHLGLAADQRYRLRAELSQIAPSMQEATLLYEDRWFYAHPGINPVAVAKAVAGLVGGQGRRGASTVSMQLARLRFGLDSATPWGKMAQMLRALQLELYYSKREILAAYLNMAPYGGNVEGVQAASLVYFGKDAARLSVAESLALAVMPQRPARRSPSAAGEESADLRRARQRLAAAWQQAHLEADASTLGLNGPLRLQPRAALPWHAPHLALRHLQPQGGAVSTTVELPLQMLFEAQVRRYLQPRAALGLRNAAAMLVDSRDMGVLASVGSAAFGDADIAGQVDGTRAARSPGSTLKPFIYALALERGLIHPRSLLRDAPMRFGSYNPENFDSDFAGPVSASAALIRSRNVPAVYLETLLRRSNTGRVDDPSRGLYGLLRRAGVGRLQPAEHYGLSLVLGGLELTLQELAGLYAALAQGGVHRPLRERLDAPWTAGTSLMAPEAAALTLDMLRANDSPVGPHGAVTVRDSLPVAWKTGTSYGYRDAWTAGVLGPYVLVVWVGNFDSHGNPALVGLGAAAPLFFALAEASASALGLREAAAYVPPQAAPLNTRRVEVCAVSGQLPSAACPHRVSTWFIPGVSPIDTCDIHRALAVDAAGWRACPGELAGTRREVYEMWPSELAALFDRAGLPRARPPPYAPRCGFDARAESGRPPRITSPQPGIVYALRATPGTEQRIFLTANADADVESLRWFVDEQMVGKSGRAEPLLWTARPGDFMVRVVDDSGRVDARWLHVAAAP